jgi:hypothetical protein
VHCEPHWPLPQPPKQPDELHEHGQFCGWLKVQQLWELQPPEELELLADVLELELLDELDEVVDEPVPVHWNPHWPPLQPPKQLLPRPSAAHWEQEPLFHEHGAVLRLQQPWEVQPEELALVLELEELDELLLELLEDVLDEVEPPTKV